MIFDFFIRQFIACEVGARFIAPVGWGRACRFQLSTIIFTPVGWGSRTPDYFVNHHYRVHCAPTADLRLHLPIIIISSTGRGLPPLYKKKTCARGENINVLSPLVSVILPIFTLPGVLLDLSTLVDSGKQTTTKTESENNNERYC